jgi:hypothetical protein
MDMAAGKAAARGAGKAPAPKSSYTVLFVGLGVIFLLVIALVLFFALRG